MEGIYFYWIVWIAWTYITFIFEKSKLRLMTASILLVLLIFSNYQLRVFGQTINLSLISCLFIGYFIISRKKNSSILYYLCVCVICTSAFMAFRLFQLYDPVWVMFHPTLKLALILLLLTLFLIKEQKLRMAVLFASVAQGEMVYSLFVSYYVMPFSFNQLEGLDVAAISVGLSFLWFGFERFVEWLDKYVKQKTMVGVLKR